MPSRRRPFDAEALRDNEFEWDDQDKDLQFFGAFTSRNVSERVKAEAYVYGLREDAPDSTNREIMTPGIRFHRLSKKGDWHGEVELTAKSGGRRRARTATWI